VDAGLVTVRLNAQRVIEPEDNPFLRPFYEGERGAGFQAQFAFLVGALNSCTRWKWVPKSRNDRRWRDYIFEKDKIFAYINLH